jgi:hypothetical protein
VGEIVGALRVFFLVLVFSDDYDVGLDLAVLVDAALQYLQPA